MRPFDKKSTKYENPKINPIPKRLLDCKLYAC